MIQITTTFDDNFPTTYLEHNTHGPVIETGAGIVMDMIADVDRASTHMQIEIHARDGSRAYRATIMNVVPSRKFPGRVHFFYADAQPIAPAPSPFRNPVHYKD